MAKLVVFTVALTLDSAAALGLAEVRHALLEVEDQVFGVHAAPIIAVYGVNDMAPWGHMYVNPGLTEPYFKERRIKVQFIDLKEKEMSKGELTSVMQAVGGIDKLLNPKAKDEETLALIQHLTPSQRFDKLLENQQVLAEPIVRNGKKATVGYCPDVWGAWE